MRIERFSGGVDADIAETLLELFISATMSSETLWEDAGTRRESVSNNANSYPYACSGLGTEKAETPPSDGITADYRSGWSSVDVADPKLNKRQWNSCASGIRLHRRWLPVSPIYRHVRNNTFAEPWRCSTRKAYDECSAS